MLSSARGPWVLPGHQRARVDTRSRLLAAGCWLLALGCWLLAPGFWLLTVGCGLWACSGVNIAFLLPSLQRKNNPKPTCCPRPRWALIRRQATGPAHECQLPNAAAAASSFDAFAASFGASSGKQQQQQQKQQQAWQVQKIM